MDVYHSTDIHKSPICQGMAMITIKPLSIFVISFKWLILHSLNYEEFETKDP